MIREKIGTLIAAAQYHSTTIGAVLTAAVFIVVVLVCLTVATSGGIQ